jgi:broad specificity phosphatase PhoE
MARNLLLIRHGTTGREYQGRYFGRTDLPLSEEGGRQALRLRPLLASRARADCRTVCSPLRRAAETAAQAFPGIVPETDPDLREVDFGDWEGMTFTEIQTGFPREAGQWARFDPKFGFPGGERLDDFISRVKRLAGRLAAAPHETLVVFSHAGVIRMLLCHFLGIDPSRYLLFEIQPAAVATLQLQTDGAVLAGLNETASQETA